MKLRIIPYARNSQSARQLAEMLTERLGYKVWRGLPMAGRLNINWGSKRVGDGPWLNAPKFCANARDKRKAFELWSLNGVPCVPHTKTKAVAESWLKAGKTVFARTAGGQAGSGIQVIEPGDRLPEAQLYTQYVKKRKEFRVHVFRDQVLTVLEKRKKRGVEADPLIRSHHRGWVFCQQDIVEPDGLRVLAVDAIRTLGLDFGGVDIIWNEFKNQCYVLEVNTAPGLEGKTLELYTDALLTA